MPELSVIIPAYNVEDFISLSIDSVLNQEFKDMEIIVVDDASKDRTKDIISAYSKKYSFITMIENDSNIGAGKSRNYGIQVANGKYIGFIDGDDWVDLNYYSTLISVANSTYSDVVIAGIRDEYNNHLSSEMRYVYANEFTIDGRTGLRLLTKSENMGTFITPIMNNKIYRKEFLLKNRIACSDNKSWQDDYFSFFAILHADKITFTPETVYHYRQRHSSTTHEATDSKSKIDNCLDVLSKIKFRLQDSDMYSVYQHEYQSFMERCISSLLYMIRNETEQKKSDDLCYLFSSLMKISDIGNIIRYLDNERIYRFFNI